MSALDKNTNLKLPLHTAASFSAVATAHKGVFLCSKKWVQGISLHASLSVGLPCACIDSTSPLCTHDGRSWNCLLLLRISWTVISAAASQHYSNRSLWIQSALMSTLVSALVACWLVATSCTYRPITAHHWDTTTQPHSVTSRPTRSSRWWQPGFHQPFWRLD